MGQDGQIRKSATPEMTPAQTSFEELLAADKRAERRLFWGEIAALIATIALMLWRLSYTA